MQTLGLAHDVEDRLLRGAFRPPRTVHSVPSSMAQPFGWAASGIDGCARRIRFWDTAICPRCSTRRITTPELNTQGNGVYWQSKRGIDLHRTSFRTAIAAAVTLGVALIGSVMGNGIEINEVSVPVQEIAWNQPLPHARMFAQWKNVAPRMCRVLAPQALAVVSALYPGVAPAGWLAPQVIYVQRTGLLGDIGTSSSLCSYVVLFTGRDLTGKFPPCIHGCTEYWLQEWPKFREKTEEWYGAIINGQTGKIGYGPFFGAAPLR